MPKTKGYVLYEGPSAINGENIAAILTLNSTNKKTGNMAQLWILHKDIPPHIAQKTGDDDAVCGDCPIKKECYVLTFQGPLSVWNAYKRGSYVKLNPALTVSNMLDEKLAEKALKKGFRYFRIKPAGAINFEKEITCPSDIGIQCIDCKLCNGSKQAKNITIEAHGARAAGIAYA